MGCAMRTIISDYDFERTASNGTVVKGTIYSPEKVIWLEFYDTADGLITEKKLPLSDYTDSFFGEFDAFVQYQVNLLTKKIAA